MYQISLVGIGVGNLSYLTDGAKEAIKNSQLVLIPKKGDEKSDLAQLRRVICTEKVGAKFIEFDLPVRNKSERYLEDVEAWHDEIAEVWKNHLIEYLPNGGTVSFLIWGDPSLYDSSIRVSKRLVQMMQLSCDVDIKVIPGITSIQALTAAHAITLNELAEPVLITTGRKLRQDGWPQYVDTVAVMLDSGGAFAEIDAKNKTIWWGAYLGMEMQTLISGELSNVYQEILNRRSELRNKHGWIMDVYIIRSSRLPSRRSSRVSAV